MQLFLEVKTGWIKKELINFTKADPPFILYTCFEIYF